MKISTFVHQRHKPEHAALLKAIAAYHAQHGYPPALRDLAAAVNMSLTGVNHQIGILQGLSLVTRNPKTARTLMLTDAGRKVAEG